MLVYEGKKITERNSLSPHDAAPPASSLFAQHGYAGQALRAGPRIAGVRRDSAGRVFPAAPTCFARAGSFAGSRRELLTVTDAG